MGSHLSLAVASDCYLKIADAAFSGTTRGSLKTGDTVQRQFTSALIGTISQGRGKHSRWGQETHEAAEEREKERGSWTSAVGVNGCRTLILSHLPL